MSKGDETRQQILAQALDRVTEVGLEGLTIGTLARQVGLSKSGLYAHFASKEDLQCAVLDTAAERYVDAVLAPALKQPRGLPRIRALFERWIAWADDDLPGGCPFIASATELDDRPGPVRDRLVEHVQDVLDAIERAAGIAVREGHFRTDLDGEQLAFELWAIVVAYHHYRRLLRSEHARERAVRAFEALIDRAARA